ncbi:hypothetical protein OPS25_04130 [Alteromonas ponticola]|uniref:Lipoprotein n=1 Tax=Alteromonas aquimaris TaxID=2998417 RepID=A0ABT3P4I4_9ALTE|nr:hypothetical protein [Alteromonas aquimaris]MCW8107691.1 hypothetical protein [Alteromonas aquimaris]
MSSKKVLFAVCTGILILGGCASTPSAGTIPTLANGEQREPDISSKYVEQGAWFNSSKNEKLDYPDFADQKCKERGFSKYVAYEAGYASTTSVVGLPSGDTSRTIDIWCEK